MNCKLHGVTGKGRCCCNCRHQMLALKHPENRGVAKGPANEIMGALCARPGLFSETGRKVAFFFESGHGICEAHSFRLVASQATPGGPVVSGSTARKQA